MLHRLGAEVAAIGDRLFIVLFEQNRADQADERGGPRKLPFVDLPRLTCTCGGELEAFVAASKNYAYRCSTCSRSVELPELVPKRDERFEYHGFGLDSDYDGKAQPIRTI